MIDLEMIKYLLTIIGIFILFVLVIIGIVFMFNKCKPKRCNIDNSLNENFDYCQDGSLGCYDVPP